MNNKLQKIREKISLKGDKKKIENLFTVVIVLIITIIAINLVFSDGKENYKKEETDDNGKILANVLKSEDEKYENDDIEKRLEMILSKMEGVGKVSVMITYAQSSEIVPMQNESIKSSKADEKDSNGGTRIVEENEVTTEIIYANNEIETQTIKSPVAKGAIIIAEGASDAMIKSNIVSAVEAITGLATYKVQVFEMN